jgi:hypothetical protein
MGFTTDFWGKSLKKAQITVSSFKAQTKAATHPNKDHPKKRFKAKIAPVLARRLLKAIANGKR